MTQTEHEYWLHVCKRCGRTYVSEYNNENRDCKGTVEYTEEKRKKIFNRTKDIDAPAFDYDSWEDTPRIEECGGEIITSRMTPEEDIFDKAGIEDQGVKQA